MPAYVFEGKVFMTSFQVFFCDCEEMVVVQEEAGVCVCVCVFVCVTSTLQWQHGDERICLSGGGCLPQELFRVVFCSRGRPSWGCIRATPSF